MSTLLIIPPASFAMALRLPGYLRQTSRFFSFTAKPRPIAPRLKIHQVYLRPFHSTLPKKMGTNNDQLQLSNLFDVKGQVALVTGGGQ